MNKLEKIVEDTKSQIKKATNLVLTSAMLIVPIIAINIAYTGLEAGAEAIQSRKKVEYNNAKVIEVKGQWGHNIYHTKGTFELPTGERFYAYDNAAVLEGKIFANTILSRLEKDSLYDVKIIEGYICGSRTSTTIVDAK